MAMNQNIDVMTLKYECITKNFHKLFQNDY